MAVGRAAQQGWGLVAVLIVLAIAALGLSQMSEGWLQDSRRAKEQELLRIGRMYAVALARYRDMSPGSVKQLPKELDDLLLDRRFIGTIRHLRELYRDPVAHDSAWIAIRDEAGRIEGVRSSSEDAPLIKAEISLGPRKLPPATRYSDWHFLADPPDAAQSPFQNRARQQAPV